MNGLSFIASLLVSCIASPFIMKALVAAKSRQTISQHIQEHAHKQGTPTMGGIIVLVGVLAGFAVSWTPALLSPLLILIGFGFVGFADDYLMPRLVKGSRGFDWKSKLLFQIAVAAGALYLSGERNPWAIGLGVFILLFFCNAYNFSDGLDSLAGGIGVILTSALLAVSMIMRPAFPLVSSNPHNFSFYYYVNASGAAIFDKWTAQGSPLVGIVGLALLAGFIPFLFFNAPPAKVFMGDVGSLPIGGLIGLLWWQETRFLYHNANPMTLVAMTILIAILFVELLPVPLQVGWVKIFKRRFFNFKTPVHHAFQEKGWPETRITWLFHLFTASTCILAIIFLAWSLPPVRQFVER